LTTLKSHHSKPPKKPTATKGPKPAPNWMQAPEATPLERNPPPKPRRPQANTPPDKPKATPKKPSTKAKAAATRRTPRTH
jgi:hypothetical protein